MDKKSPEELLELIREACTQLGWDIAMDASDQAIDGIVIGRTPYVEDIVNQIETGDAYEIYSLTNNEQMDNLH